MAKGGDLSNLSPASYSFLILSFPATESVSGLPSKELGKPTESPGDHNSRQAYGADLISSPFHRAERLAWMAGTETGSERTSIKENQKHAWKSSRHKRILLSVIQKWFGV